jgi:hypothetical protein
MSGFVPTFLTWVDWKSLDENTKIALALMKVNHGIVAFIRSECPTCMKEKVIT